MDAAKTFELDPENAKGPDIVVEHSTYNPIVWLTLGQELRDLLPKEARQLAKALKAHAASAEGDGEEG